VRASIVLSPGQRGRNVDQQISQLSKRRDGLLPKLNKMLSRRLAPGYLEKVPERVRQEMDNKVSRIVFFIHYVGI
jgi:hypothetical protein